MPAPFEGGSQGLEGCISRISRNRDATLATPLSGARSLASWLIPDSPARPDCLNGLGCPSLPVSLIARQKDCDHSPRHADAWPPRIGCLPRMSGLDGYFRSNSSWLPRGSCGSRCVKSDPLAVVFCLIWVIAPLDDAHPGICNRTRCNYESRHVFHKSSSTQKNPRSAGRRLAQHGIMWRPCLDENDSSTRPYQF